VVAFGVGGHPVTRAAYQRLRAEFDTRCRDYARGAGLPSAVVNSESAVTQWIADDLTRRADRLAVAAVAENEAWLGRVTRWVLVLLWAAVPVTLAVDLATLPSGTHVWTAQRTATLAVFVLLAAAATGFGAVYQDTGGLLRYLAGVDGRLSPARTLSVLWATALACCFVFVGVLVTVGVGSAARQRAARASLSTLHPAYPILLATPLLVGAVASTLTGVRLRRRMVPWLPNRRAQLRDLVSADGGWAALAAAQWLVANLVGLGYLIGQLASRPNRMPVPPATLVAVLVVSGLAYGVAAVLESNRPVLAAVVRGRTPGELDGPIAPGDLIELRGAWFVPGVDADPHRLARLVVRIGASYVHVPLVPGDESGFANPTASTVVVTVPAELPPGRYDVTLVTAAGVETNAYPIDVAPLP
jgi:hypothetical protein